MEDEVFQTFRANLEAWIEDFPADLPDTNSHKFAVPSGREYFVHKSWNEQELIVIVELRRGDALGSKGYYYILEEDNLRNSVTRVEYLSEGIYCYWNE